MSILAHRAMSSVSLYWHGRLVGVSLRAPFDFSVSRDHELPVGTQLAWRLQGLILEGRLEPGERLPSVRALAQAMRVNVNTVRAVYGRLEERGLVISEQGRGTFVARKVPPADEWRARDRLRAEIAELEAELAL